MLFISDFCQLTLDPNTAQCRLSLSEMNRVVIWSGEYQRYSDHPERFNRWPQVMCKERVCGRCYWEVEQISGGGVYISVSYKDIRRKGRSYECLFGYNSQSWSLWCSSTLSFCHNNIETEIPGPPSSRIGVYVDHSAGTLSFYRVSDTMTLMHTVHTTFTQPLYGGFWTDRQTLETASEAGAISALQDCFEQTTKITFKEAATDDDTVNLEEYTASVTGYISKCIDDVTISHTIITRPNQKPWMTAEVCMLLRTQDSAFRAALLRLRQGIRPAAEYTMEFQTLAAGTRWNEPTLIDAFLTGLWAELQAELDCKQEATSLNEVVMLLTATSIESPEADQQVTIPQEYADLVEVFSPTKVTLVPPHWEGDCAIALKEGTMPPRCRIYPFSQEEERAMERYILEALEQGNHLYCKEEKREFHHREVDFLGYVIQEGSVRMDAVKDWPRPRTRKALQHFLGFTNFYRRFIKNFSSIAKPLTDQLWGLARQVRWTPSVERSFEGLKVAFITAPVLQQPDPERPFMVEVDALDTGLGAVLSQHMGGFKPVVYFFQKLSPAEWNYGVGDHELLAMKLLAMKLAFEEWRHWLEGA
ncbi:hypothetical protein P4O66_003490 [Electrophorus voltai]|uniref:B30.2/SPRY domain-containing protein n=1 Tax=Electrophorus voltai TaxID=2609070 RepID=A0AAD8YS60_9TELE|nr:hypothetical protein P4O66_003490 [Electrophorus voltai]